MAEAEGDAGRRRASEAAFAEAVAALRRGELVVFPTETLYGIGCDALDVAALDRLRAAKRRPAEKGIAVIVGDLAMLELVAREIPAAARRLIEGLWPGPLTVLLPARPGLPEPLVVEGRVAVRLSGHPVARRLSQALGGPIAAPSANLSGEAPARDVAAARACFAQRVAVYLDLGPIEGAPSTLVDPGPPLRILREGAMPRTRIEAVLRDQPRAARH